jgi:hypothetical protein
VTALGPGTSLVDKLTSTREALDAHDMDGACGRLAAFGHAADAQSGKKLSPDVAAELSSDAGRIRTVLAC